MDWLNRVGKSRNNVIDFSKYVAALMVMAIHTSLFLDINKTFYFLIIGVVCRLAVPFFAICTGYFIGIKGEFEHGKLKDTKSNSILFWKQWKKMFVLYCMWTIIYLMFSIPMWKEIGWFGTWAFIDFGIATIIKGSHYHLWYLLSILYVFPILFFVLRKVHKRFYLIVICTLYGMKVLLYGYRTFLKESAIIDLLEIFDKVPAVSDAVFCILPFVWLGVYISRNEKTGKNNFLLLFIIFLTAWIVEASILTGNGQEAFSYIIFTMPTSYCLFRAILNTEYSAKLLEKINLGEISMYVYCVHPIFIECIGINRLNSILLFILTGILSTIFGLIVMKAKNRLQSC